MGMFNQEYLDESGAHVLARKIRGYWARRGHSVKLTIFPVYLSATPSDSERPIWVIRSDMQNGMPRNA